MNSHAVAEAMVRTPWRGGGWDSAMLMSLYDPAAGQHIEALCGIGSLDDPEGPPAGQAQGMPELVAGEAALHEPDRRGDRSGTAFAPSRSSTSAPHEPPDRQDVPLAPVDAFPSARAFAPLRSAVRTVWLSMIEAKGDASRPARSRPIMMRVLLVLPRRRPAPSGADSSRPSARREIARQAGAARRK